MHFDCKVEYHWTRSLKSFYFNLLIDDVLLLWVCHLAFSVCQTCKKHPIYIKISTYRCDLFNYLILNKSHMQCGYAWIGHAYSVYVTEYNYYKYKYNIIKYIYNIHLNTYNDNKDIFLVNFQIPWVLQQRNMRTFSLLAT